MTYVPRPVPVALAFLACGQYDTFRGVAIERGSPTMTKVWGIVECELPLPLTREVTDPLETIWGLHERLDAEEVRARDRMRRASRRK